LALMSGILEALAPVGASDRGQRPPAGTHRPGTRSDPTEVRRFIDGTGAPSGSSSSARPRACRRPPYYQRAKGKHSVRERDDERLLPIMRVIHKANFEADA